MHVFSKTLIKWYEPAAFWRQRDNRFWPRIGRFLVTLYLGLFMSFILIAKLNPWANPGKFILSPMYVVPIIALVGFSLVFLVRHFEVLSPRISIRPEGILWQEFQRHGLLRVGDIERITVRQVRSDGREMTMALVVSPEHAGEKVFGLPRQLSIDALAQAVERIGIPFKDESKGRVMDLDTSHNPRPAARDAYGQ